MDKLLRHIVLCGRSPVPGFRHVRVRHNHFLPPSPNQLALASGGADGFQGKTQPLPPSPDHLARASGGVDGSEGETQPLPPSPDHLARASGGVDGSQGETQPHDGGEENCQHRETVVLKVHSHILHRNQSQHTNHPWSGRREAASAPVLHHWAQCAEVKVMLHKLALWQGEIYHCKYMVENSPQQQPHDLSSGPKQGHSQGHGPQTHPLAQGNISLQVHGREQPATAAPRSFFWAQARSWPRSCSKKRPLARANQNYCTFVVENSL